MNLLWYLLQAAIKFVRIDPRQLLLNLTKYSNII